MTVLAALMNTVAIATLATPGATTGAEPGTDSAASCQPGVSAQGTRASM